MSPLRRPGMESKSITATGEEDEEEEEEDDEEEDPGLWIGDGRCRSGFGVRGTDGEDALRVMMDIMRGDMLRMRAGCVLRMS